LGGKKEATVYASHITPLEEQHRHNAKKYNFSGERKKSLAGAMQSHQKNNNELMKGNYTYCYFQEKHKKNYVVKIKETNITYTCVIIF
jgi:hypothetical protein